MGLDRGLKRRGGYGGSILVQFYYCRGGDKDAPKAAALAGVLYGMRGDYTHYDHCRMIDFNFHSEPTLKRWRNYVSLVWEQRPDMALIPDYFAHVDKATMLRQVDELRIAGARRVAVCPKFAGAVAHIPKECIIAISVPTTYAGFMPLYDELIGRDLHLLGGHPDQQAFCIFHRYEGLNIISADGNIAGLKGALGQYWSVERNDWIAVEQEKTLDLTVRSLQNTVTTLHNAPKRYTAKRVRRVAQLTLFVL